MERLSARHAWISDLGQLIHQSGGLGMVQPRAGGIPMRLRYFLPPYELLDQDAGTILPLTVTTLDQGNLGYLATLTLRPSTEPFLLPLSSLLTSSGQDWFP